MNIDSLLATPRITSNFTAAQTLQPQARQQERSQGSAFRNELSVAARLPLPGTSDANIVGLMAGLDKAPHAELEIQFETVQAVLMEKLELTGRHGLAGIASIGERRSLDEWGCSGFSVTYRNGFTHMFTGNDASTLLKTMEMYQATARALLVRNRFLDIRDAAALSITAPANFPPFDFGGKRADELNEQFDALRDCATGYLHWKKDEIEKNPGVHEIIFKYHVLGRHLCNQQDNGAMLRDDASLRFVSVTDHAQQYKQSSFVPTAHHLMTGASSSYSASPAFPARSSSGTGGFQSPVSESSISSLASVFLKRARTEANTKQDPAVLTIPRSRLNELMTLGDKITPGVGDLHSRLPAIFGRLDPASKSPVSFDGVKTAVDSYEVNAYRVAISPTQYETVWIATLPGNPTPVDIRVPGQRDEEQLSKLKKEMHRGRRQGGRPLPQGLPTSSTVSGSSSQSSSRTFVSTQNLLLPRTESAGTLIETVQSTGVSALTNKIRDAFTHAKAVTGYVQFRFNGLIELGRKLGIPVGDNKKAALRPCLDAILRRAEVRNGRDVTPPDLPSNFSINAYGIDLPNRTSEVIWVMTENGGATDICVVPRGQDDYVSSFMIRGAKAARR